MTRVAASVQRGGAHIVNRPRRGALAHADEHGTLARALNRRPPGSAPSLFLCGVEVFMEFEAMKRGWKLYIAATLAASIWRAGQCMGLMNTPLPAQHVVSRVKRWLDSGGSTNSCGARVMAQRDCGRKGNSVGGYRRSCRLRAARQASLPARRAIPHPRPWRAAPYPRHLSNSQVRATGSVIVSARAWPNSMTAMPWSRIVSTKASCSWRAFFTQITSSNSNSWQLLGVRR